MKQLPRRYEPSTEQANPNFSFEMKALTEIMEQEGAMLVIFPFMEWRRYLPDRKYLRDMSGLELVYEGEDASIYLHK